MGVAADLRGAETRRAKGVEMSPDVLVQDDALPVLKRLSRVRVAKWVWDATRPPSDIA
jgi:hypothetical protein